MLGSGWRVGDKQSVPFRKTEFTKRGSRKPVAERWLREAMILAIWEGTSHRQILDGLEVIERKQAHRLLFLRLAEIAPSKELNDMASEVERHLKLPPQEREALGEPLFRRLAAFTAQALDCKSK